MNNFSESIRRFNTIYGLPINDKPTLLELKRLKNFKRIFFEEYREVNEIIKNYEKAETLNEEKKIEILTSLADWFGDLIVYVYSESQKYGINMDEVLKIIMESNFSKLGSDGKPIIDGRGKVMCGPNYFAPESRIKDFLAKK